MYFNSQPHEEADVNDDLKAIIRTNFNSQPHEEADSVAEMIAFCPIISTHSLTRRLTFNERFLFHTRSISTHSLTRRLTIAYAYIIA